MCGYENDTAFGVKSLQAESRCPFREILQQLAEYYYKKKILMEFFNFHLNVISLFTLKSPLVKD